MKFKEGQKVKVIDQKHGHEFEIGSIVEIDYIDPHANGVAGDYSCSNETETWFLTDEELEEIT